MKICKFGGTSVASAPQFRQVAEILRMDSERRAVVVSAPGKRDDADTKVTDLLIECARQYDTARNVDRLLDPALSRFREISDELGLTGNILNVIHADLKQRLQTPGIDVERRIDIMKAGGEDNNAKLIAEYLREEGFHALYMNPQEAGLLLSNESGNAQVLTESYENLRSLKERSEIIVFPGFFGYTPEGDLVTFPRGGSDITGSILAAALQVDLYENFTDVDSVYAVNPTLVDEPKKIPELTYQEMRELSYAGFSVVHEEALVPAFRAGVPVCVKNTNNPEGSGTMIVSKRDITINPVVGIAGGKGFCTIYLSKYLMNREVGFGRRLMQILEEEELSYEHTPSGIDNISVILQEDQLWEGTEERIVKRIREELDVDDIVIERNLSLIMIVGEGMDDTIGVASRATNALSKENINIEMINQGSSEVSMMFGVKSNVVDKAVQAMYQAFFGTTA